MKTRIGIIGNGKMAVDCLKIMLSYEQAELMFVIYQPSKDPMNALPDFCHKENIECKVFNKLNSPETLEYLNSKNTDLIFSINNYRIISKELISLPKKGLINFHNGPLPMYGGVNIPSWVILNGEKEHGVTWHYVDEGIDTGDIIAKAVFPIDDDTTAARLMSKSVSEGLKLFKVIFPEILQGNNSRTPQTGNHLYFSLKDFPENYGTVSFEWNYEKISRFVRALNFFPFHNSFVPSVLEHNNQKLIINEISKVSDLFDFNTDPGSIIKLNSEELLISCSDSVISLDSVVDAEYNELSPSQISSLLQIKEGDSLTASRLV